tara:strand:- start:612 stop:1553 length:942 start_codon:yes stop_codon:yes gene_type:complete
MSSTEEIKEYVKERQNYYINSTKKKLDNLGKCVIGPNKGIIADATRDNIEYKKPLDALISGQYFFKSLNLFKLLLSGREALGHSGGSGWDCNFRIDSFFEEGIFQWFSMDDLNKDNISQIVSRHLEMNYVLGSGNLNYHAVKEMIKVEKGHCRDYNTINKALKEIKNPIIAENLKILCYLGDSETFRLLPEIGMEVYENEPELFKKLIEFSFRLALNESHARPIGGITLISENPEVKTLIDPIYLDYAVPYIFEKYAAFVGQGWHKETQEKHDKWAKTIMKKLDLDPKNVQEIINNNSDNPRTYLESFLERVS